MGTQALRVGLEYQLELQGYPNFANQLSWGAFAATLSVVVVTNLQLYRAYRQCMRRRYDIFTKEEKREKEKENEPRPVNKFAPIDRNNIATKKVHTLAWLKGTSWQKVIMLRVLQTLKTKLE